MNGKTTRTKRQMLITLYGECCQRCGALPDTATIVINRKDSNNKNTAIENLQLLCRSCVNLKSKTSEHDDLCVKTREETAISISREKQSKFYKFVYDHLDKRKELFYKELMYSGAEYLDLSPATTDRYLQKMTSAYDKLEKELEDVFSLGRKGLRFGISDEEMDAITRRIEEVQDKIKDLLEAPQREARNTLKDFFDKLFLDTRTPLEKLNTAIENLFAKREQAIGAGLFDLEAADAFGRRLKELQKEKDRLGAERIAVSTVGLRARAAEIGAGFGAPRVGAGGGAIKDQPTAQNQKDGNKVLKEINKTLDTIATNTETGGLVFA